MRTPGSDVRAANVVLDTSAYSRFRAGHAGVLAWLSAAKSIWVPTIVLGELEAGFLLGKRLAANRVALEDLLDEPFVQVLVPSREVALGYGTIFAALRRKGTPIGFNDIWIAATTIEHAGHLLTFDADFAKVPGLSVTVLTD